MVQKNTPTTDFDQDDSQPQEESFQQKYMPIVATTAVVFIGIALTPINPTMPLEGFVVDSTSTNMAAITNEFVNAAVPKSNTHLATEKVLNFRLDADTRQASDTDTDTDTKDGPLTPAKQRARLDSFRTSPLLWIIEIRHLHAERQNDITREELIVFRRTYPANPYERLLPTALQVLKTD